MTDPQTVAEHLAAIRRMVARAEHKSDILAALDALALAWVEPAPAVAVPTLEAQLAEAEKAYNQAYREWLSSDNMADEKVHRPAREVKRIKALIAARDAMTTRPQ